MNQQQNPTQRVQTVQPGVLTTSFAPTGQQGPTSNYQQQGTTFNPPNTFNQAPRQFPGAFPNNNFNQNPNQFNPNQNAINPPQNSFNQNTFNQQKTQPQAQIQLTPEQVSEKMKAIVDYIDNPNEAKSKEIATYIHELAKSQSDVQFKYSSQSYCHLSGDKIKGNEKEDFLIINEETYNRVQLEKFYKRGDVYDFSLGDIKYYSYGAAEEKTIQLELETLQRIYGEENLKMHSENAEKHYNKRLEEPITFKCSKSGEVGVISDKIIIDGQPVHLRWAVQHINELEGAIKEYVKSQINNYPALTNRSQVIYQPQPQAQQLQQAQGEQY